MPHKQEPIEQITNDISSGLIILVESSKERYMETITKIIKSLTDKGYIAVIFSIAVPTSDLMKLLKQHGINISRMFFIDSLSRAKEKGEKVILISSLSDLTAITAAFDTICSNLEKENKK